VPTDGAQASAAPGACASGHAHSAETIITSAQMQAISNKLDELIAKRKAREEMVRNRSEVLKYVCYGSALGVLGVVCALVLN
jgi:type III secretion system FlhB-like substrate exporter